jgi:hypothetical protein
MDMDDPASCKQPKMKEGASRVQLGRMETFCLSPYPKRPEPGAIQAEITVLQNL